MCFVLCAISLVELFFICWLCAIQTVSEMFKKAIMSLMQEFMPLVSSVTALMMEMYQVLKHSSILDVAKQVSLHSNKLHFIFPTFSKVFYYIALDLFLLFLDI